MILQNSVLPTEAIRPNQLSVASLNMYSRIVGDEIYEYIANHPEVDVWCLQEVNSSTIDTISNENRHSAMLETLRHMKPDFLAFHAPVLLFVPQDDTNFKSDYGTTILCRYGLPVVDYRQLQVSGHINKSLWTPESPFDHARALQYIRLDWKDGNLPITIYNYHGLWVKSPEGQSSKQDTPERINIAKTIRELIDSQESYTILCGDFNLDPDTQSMAIMRGELVDLIAKYEIKTTRSILYKKPAPYADYILASDALAIEKFAVEDVVVSDHLPLIATFTLAS